MKVGRNMIGEGQKKSNKLSSSCDPFCWCRTIAALLLVFLMMVSFAESKSTSGKFRLSGIDTEFVLGSFAVSPRKMGTLKVEFKSKENYDANKELFVRLYRDDKWSEFKKAPSCTEKVPFSLTNEQVTLKRKKKHFEGEISMELNNHKDDQTHYYYFVVTDCSLEYYMHDESIPNMSYTVTTWNDGSHISADEDHLENLHTVTLLISGILALVLSVIVVIELYEKSTVHAAMLWVTAAAASDSFSSLFELIHLSLYAHNGIGSYSMDALSAHLEAICDSLIALLLLSVAAGWTLPSDAVAVHQNASPLQKLFGGFQSPFAAMRKFNRTGVLAIAILITHIVLAQAGRMVNDDFDSYHDLEHLPGKFLMLNRIVLGVLMMACCFSTRARCPPSLRRFYLQLTIVGTLWFMSLPVLTWVVNTLVPYHLRHRAVGVYGAVLQTAGIVLLSWLVTSQSSSYHKLSHLSSSKENFTETLSRRSSGIKEEPHTWMFGKTKVRLD